MLRSILLVLLALLCAVSAAGCRRSPAAAGAPTPEQALAGLARAGEDRARLFDVLDQESRWSVMTLHRDLRQLCELVRAYYPRDRQARELVRCRAAEAAIEPRDFFARQAGGWGMLAGLQGLTGKEPLLGVGEQRTVATSRQPLLFCRSGGRWGYCGLRQQLERMKLKTARDLATVQDNAEAYKGR